MSERACCICSVTFVPHPRDRRNRAYCSPACYVWARRHPDVPRPLSRSCVTCDTDISERNIGAKYCSTRCGETARGQRLAEPLPERACALPECGKVFQPRREMERCCSELHGKRLYNRESRADGRQASAPWSDRRRDGYHRRRARKKAAATGNPVLFREIAERDAWTCHLCASPVGRLPWPDPMSPSLDHVLPLSKGGLHDPRNVRLAHLRCNSAKGDRTMEHLLRIG